MNRKSQPLYRKAKMSKEEARATKDRSDLRYYRAKANSRICWCSPGIICPFCKEVEQSSWVQV